ncbi:MAG: hypothetical protein H6730_31490 [Deltaproteobacteria bacterium]|nr:hypothetical protein [Deltaproteobacteria bacterium]
MALVALVASTGCGVMFQAAGGFTEKQQREATRTREVRLSGVPEGAVVQRRDELGTHPLLDPRRDPVTYRVRETLEVPRSRTPLYVGIAVDLALTTAAAVAAVANDENDEVRLPLGYTAFYAGMWTAADIIAALTYARTQEPKVVATEPLEDAQVSYVVRLGDEVRTATLAAVWQDEAVFDFQTAPDARAPGEARLAAVPPVPPRRFTLSASAPRPPPPERWYGWQLIPMDVLAIAGVIAGFTQDKSELLVGGMALYALGPPAAHLAHGRYAQAGGSLGLRVVAPITAMGVGALGGLVLSPILTCRDDVGGWCTLGSVVVGGAVLSGIVALMVPVLDASALAWAPDDREEEPAQVDLLLAPGATSDGTFTLGLAGRF